ncbi:MAG: deoxyribonuclease IV [Nitrososphaerales archaeon]
MKVGLHVSISGSIDRAVDNASVMNCTAFQIFTRNPRGWIAKDLVKGDVEGFKKKLAASKIDQNSVCAHMPYLPNLSSPEKDLYKKSLNTLINEVKRCGVLGVPYLVIHLGSHLGAGAEVGIRNLVYACNTAVKKVKNDVTILLENTAGTKNSVGSRFEEMEKILEQLEHRKRFGVCLDTCHAFAAGYDLRGKDVVDDVIAAFDKKIGMKELRIVHLNDSKGDINCNADRHEHIGMGYIGNKGFKAILTNNEVKRRLLILETPIDDRRDDKGNLEKVRELAS